jgi:thiosulfate/3-mercaptopyruvate sulfurtransferase
MICERKSRRVNIPWRSSIILVVLLATGSPLFALHAWRRGADPSSSSQTGPAAQPWTPAQTIQPADLVKELGSATRSNRPTVVCVGFQALYRAGHVPGASFHGPASSPSGLDDLKAWAQTMSRSTNVVLYCGCCPMAQCPNLRPAFTALRNMGFTHVRLLMLPNNFATDWASKGYPVEPR